MTFWTNDIADFNLKAYQVSDSQSQNKSTEKVLLLFYTVYLKTLPMFTLGICPI